MITEDGPAGYWQSNFEYHPTIGRPDLGMVVRVKNVRRSKIQAKWDLRKTTRAKRALAKKLLKQQPEIEI